MNTKSGATRFSKAGILALVKAHDYAAVRVALKDYPQVLRYAIGRGKNLTLAAYLIERGATPEHCMWAAAYNDDPAAIKLLCRYASDVRCALEPFRGC